MSKLFTEHNGCTILFVSLVLYFVAAPFFEFVNSMDWPVLSFLTARRTSLAFFFLILLAAVQAMARSRRQFWVSLSLAVPAFFFSSAELLRERGTVWLIAWLVSVLGFLAYTAVQVLIYVVQGARVGRDRLFGSMAVYLLIGFVWALLYAIVEVSIPGSFQGLRDPSSVTSTASDLFYFSFVTLTTTGFGDISPVSPQARTWAVLESVTGVLYIATLVARLVGLYGRDDRYE